MHRLVRRFLRARIASAGCRLRSMGGTPHKCPPRGPGRGGGPGPDISPAPCGSPFQAQRAPPRDKPCSFPLAASPAAASRPLTQPPANNEMSALRVRVMAIPVVKDCTGVSLVEGCMTNAVIPAPSMVRSRWMLRATKPRTMPREVIPPGGMRGPYRPEHPIVPAGVAGWSR